MGQQQSVGTVLPIGTVLICNTLSFMRLFCEKSKEKE